jgi:hypothetical protein
MRQNPKLDIEAAITELAVGEALVSFLDEKGRPGVTERLYVLPPASQIGPITPAQRQTLLSESIVAGVYEKQLDRESAYEKIKGHAAERLAAKAAQAPAAKGATTGAAPAETSGGLLDSLGDMLGGGARRTRASAAEQLFKSAASSMGREVGRQILRGVLGGIFGGSKR